MLLARLAPGLANDRLAEIQGPGGKAAGQGLWMPNEPVRAILALARAAAGYMYGYRELLDDASGYGTVLKVVRDQRTEYLAGTGAVGRAAPLNGTDAATFVRRRYAIVETVRALTIYRFYDSSGATRDGRYWSPARPTLAFDRMGLPSFHNTARNDLAMLHRWN